MASFYTILGLEPNATAAEIKKRYHQLSLKYHPDRSSDPGSEEKFKQVLEAYNVLKDADKRTTYDYEEAVRRATNIPPRAPRGFQYPEPPQAAQAPQASQAPHASPASPFTQAQQADTYTFFYRSAAESANSSTRPRPHAPPQGNEDDPNTGYWPGEIRRAQRDYVERMRREREHIERSEAQQEARRYEKEMREMASRMEAQRRARAKLAAERRRAREVEGERRRAREVELAKERLTALKIENDRLLRILGFLDSDDNVDIEAMESLEAYSAAYTDDLSLQERLNAELLSLQQDALARETAEAGAQAARAAQAHARAHSQPPPQPRNRALDRARELAQQAHAAARARKEADALAEACAHAEAEARAEVQAEARAEARTQAAQEAMAAQIRAAMGTQPPPPQQSRYFASHPDVVDLTNEDEGDSRPGSKRHAQEAESEAKRPCPATEPFEFFGDLAQELPDAPPAQYNPKGQEWYQQSVPQAVPQGFPQGFPQRVSQAVPQAVPQGFPQGVPQGVPQGFPQGVPQGIPQGFPQGAPAPPPPVDPAATAEELREGYLRILRYGKDTAIAFFNRFADIELTVPVAVDIPVPQPQESFNAQMEKFMGAMREMSQWFERMARLNESLQGNPL